MNLKAEPTEKTITVKRFPIEYPLSAYTFPEEARIKTAHIDSEYVHLDLMDGRKLSIPLRWIPTLNHASHEEREKFEINNSRTMLVWNPEICAINDELRVADYLS